MNHANSQRLGMVRIPDAYLFTPDIYITLISRVNAGQDFHQGGLPCPIFSKYGMDLSAADINVNIVQGYTVGESLG